MNNSENLEKAMKIAGMNKVLFDKKEGLKTMVGQGGNMLSGGQKQAVAIARGLANDAPVIILDEPTSMMDSISEGLLLEGLASLEHKTMLIISHNIRILDIVNKVLFIERGAVKFYGTKTEFMELANQQALKKG
jgi:ABC-type bacteriocin/lantibiotic exporter with double-glycine peptidase domain